jgi:hypothetical protein
MPLFPVSLDLKAVACLLMLLPASLPAQAAPAIYDVEVVIFSNSTSGDNGEHWSRPGAVTADSGGFPQGEFTELDRSLYRLGGVSNALQQSRGYSVLFHRAWRQVASGQDSAPAYPVRSLATGGSEAVEGSVRLVLERFLHLDANLLLVSARAAGASGYAEASGSVPVYALREQRRIRSGELHYFDHPHFGMIALVTPYAAPEEPAVPVQESGLEEPRAPAAEALPESADDQLTR